MSAKNKAIISSLGKTLIVVGLFMSAPLAVSILYKESVCYQAFASVMVLTVIAGSILYAFFSEPSVRIRPREGFLLITLKWLTASLVSAVPFFLSGTLNSPIDCFFESLSGFTTTGATVFQHPEELPRGILLWRSITGWLGALSIISVRTDLVPTMGSNAKAISSIDINTRSVFRSHKTSGIRKNLIRLYIFGTLVFTGILLLCGMNLFDAAIHSMGAISTTGFSNYADSIGHFASPLIDWIITLFMFTTMVNYYFYFRPDALRKKHFSGHDELQLFLTMYGVLIFLSYSAIAASRMVTEEGNFTEAVFHLTAAMSTTGFAAGNFQLWPSFAKITLILAVLTGSCSSSIGSGPKVIRLLIALKMIRRGIYLRIYPNRMHTIILDGRELPQKFVSAVVSFILLFIMLLCVGSILLGFDGWSTTETVSSAISCITNLGKTFNTVYPPGYMGFFSALGKLLLCFLMLCGRLEIYPVLILFSSHYWNPNKP